MLNGLLICAFKKSNCPVGQEPMKLPEHELPLFDRTQRGLKVFGLCVQTKKTKGFPMDPCYGPLDYGGVCSMGPYSVYCTYLVRIGVQIRGPYQGPINRRVFTEVLL